jgi:hypothetical protein
LFGGFTEGKSQPRIRRFLKTIALLLDGENGGELVRACEHLPEETDLRTYKSYYRPW